MKKIIFVAASFFLSGMANSQAKTASSNLEKSKLENFSLKTGSLIKKEFIDIGIVAKVEIKVLKLTDLIANANIAGIKLETKISKSYSTDTKSCFLDADEIDGLVKSGNMLLSTLNQSAENYTEYEFSSRDGFQAGAYQSKKEWKYYLKLEKYDSDSYVWLDKEDFQKLIAMISESKAKLQ